MHVDFDYLISNSIGPLFEVFDLGTSEQVGGLSNGKNGNHSINYRRGLEGHGATNAIWKIAKERGF